MVIIIRTLGVYFVIFLIFRLMGKREIGELSVMDLVVFILLAEIAVFSIEEKEQPFWLAITPMFILLIIQRFTAYLSLKSTRLRTFLDGNPTIIIRNGKINEKEMRKQRYNIDDLLVQVREAGIIDVNEVELAVLETNGKLSVFKKEDQPPEVIDPLIIDGKFQEEALRHHQMTKTEIKKRLHSLGITDIHRISLAQIKGDGKLSIDVKDTN